MLVIGGVGALMQHGHGLPMNAFPPPSFVKAGVYAWLRDPIYVGFGLLVIGLSAATGSSAGLWLVTPITWLAMTALVFGYERHDLRSRFHAAAARPTRLSLPRPDGALTVSERLTTLLWVFGSWLMVYYAVQTLGPAPDAFSTMTAGEQRLPVVQWMEWPYVSVYLFVPLTVFVARSRRTLHLFAMSSFVGTVVAALCWVVIPVQAVNRPFTPTGWSGALLAAEQGHSSGAAALPAFHVFWVLLAAWAWSMSRRRTATGLIWLWAALVVLSCIGTGHHSIIDAAAGGLLYLVLANVERTWERIRIATERVANSWREWRVAQVRFINHGLYAGAAAATGLTLAGMTAGAGHEMQVVWVGVWILTGAGAYAQVLEGSSRLLRPFGWYGGVLGGLIGMVTSPLIGGAVMPLMAAFVVAAPWIQILGRLRCLVQGCCHGAPAPEMCGIRYRHPRSRVAQLAHLTDVPLHATPLYSIGSNVVIGLLLVRLRYVGMPDAFLVGLYLMLSGCARFVEESYRGEPQTPIIGGLRVYQWFAIASVAIGIIFTMLPPASRNAGFGPPSPVLLASAVAMFVVFAAAMGLDFPRSNRRFSRLASAD